MNTKVPQTEVIGAVMQAVEVAMQQFVGKTYDAMPFTVPGNYPPDPPDPLQIALNNAVAALNESNPALLYADDLLDVLRADNLTVTWLVEPTLTGIDGTERKAHYGEGEQPWDVMVKGGVAAHFAAGCVLKYLRRTKEDANDLTDARWYARQLQERAKAERLNDPYWLKSWIVAQHWLFATLTAEERDRLGVALFEGDAA